MEQLVHSNPHVSAWWPSNTNCAGMGMPTDFISIIINKVEKNAGTMALPCAAMLLSHIYKVVSN